MSRLKRTPTGNVTSDGRIEMRLAFCATGAGGGVDPSCGKNAEKATGVAQKASFAAKQAKGADAKHAAHAKAAVAHNAAAGFHRAAGNKEKAKAHEGFAAAHRKEISGIDKKLKAEAGKKSGTNERSAKGTSATAHRASEKANKTNNPKDHAHAAWKHGVAANKFLRLGDKAKAKEHSKLAEHHKKKTYGE